MMLQEVGRQWSQRLVEHSKKVAQQANRPWAYHAGGGDANDPAKQLQQPPILEPARQQLQQAAVRFKAA